jgi:lipoprotein-releasing system permease protein
MYRLFLAVRYLWSRPISWVSMVAIWLSVMAMIATIAVMSGFLRETRAMIRGSASDLVVTPRTSFDRRAPQGVRASFDAVEAAATAVDGVKGLAPRLVRPVLIRTDLHNDIVGMSQLLEMQSGSLFGVDVERERQASAFSTYLDKADPAARVDDPSNPFWLKEENVPIEVANQDLPVVLLGEQLFEWYRLEKGDVITLVTVPEKVDLKAIKPLSQRFLVGGAVRSGHYEFDSGQLWVSLDAAREFTQHEADCSEIAVAAQPGTDLELLRARLESALGGAGILAKVETWMDRNKQFLGAVENERAIMGVILGFFVLVACFNVFATLTIMVTDKTKDIGILNAMGATAGGMTRIFLYCGLIMALFSAAVGCASGVGLARSLNAINDAIERFFGVRIFRADIYLFREIPVQIDTELVVGVFAGTVVLAVLFSALPAVRAARMDPIRALRYE